jgi:outer membrane protein assembly factor BamB
LVYGPATDADEALKVLLEKPEWNEAECVAVVACPFTRFLTKEQQWLVVKNTTTSEITTLSEKIENTKYILELRKCISRLGELNSYLEDGFQSLSHPKTFPRGDDSIRQRIASGTKRCRQRTHLLRTARIIKITISCALIVAIIAVSGYGWLRLHTKIYFSLNVEGAGVTPNDGIKAFWNGTEIYSGEILSPGKGAFTINDSRLLPVSKETDVGLGKTLDLGSVSLTNRRVTVQFQSVPSGANVYLNGTFMGNTPFETAALPLFKSNMQASLYQYRFARVETNAIASNQIQMTFILSRVPGNEVLWHYSNGEIPTEVASLDDEGNTYLATPNHLIKLNPNGQVLWDYHKDYQNYTVPVIYNGYVFSGGQEFEAINTVSGKAVWRKTFTPGTFGSSGRFSSPAVGVNDTLLLSCADEILACTLDGTILWHGVNLKLDNEWFFSPGFQYIPLIMENGTCVYVLKDSLRTANPDNGQRSWWFKSDDGSSPGPPAGVGNRVFVICGRSVYCLDSITQSRIWKISIDHDLNNEVVVTRDNKVIFGGLDKLYVYDAITGVNIKTLRLQYTNGDLFRQDALALGKDNLVYVGGNFGLICIERNTGIVNWSSQIGGGWIHGITVSKNGRILARGNDGLTVLSGDSDTGPNHPWPMLYGNEAHTLHAQPASVWGY